MLTGHGVSPVGCSQVTVCSFWVLTGYCVSIFWYSEFAVSVSFRAYKLLCQTLSVFTGYYNYVSPFLCLRVTVLVPLGAHNSNRVSSFKIGINSRASPVIIPQLHQSTAHTGSHAFTRRPVNPWLLYFISRSPICPIKLVHSLTSSLWSLMTFYSLVWCLWIQENDRQLDSHLITKSSKIKYIMKSMSSLWISRDCAVDVNLKAPNDDASIVCRIQPLGAETYVYQSLEDGIDIICHCYTR